MGSKRKTTEDRIAKVRSLMKTKGMSQTKALKEVGMNATTFTRYAKVVAGERRRMLDGRSRKRAAQNAKKLGMRTDSADLGAAAPGRTASYYEGACGADFAFALSALRMGLKVMRLGWNNQNQHIELQVPDEHSKMSLPYLFIKTVQGNLVPWVASQTDLLAHDWALT